jgi:hypothetical protein
MRKLNGKVYLDKSDVSELKKATLYYLHHPDDKYEVLYLIDTDSSKVIINGISALENTLSWEFSSESAINLTTIEKCYKSLHIVSTQKMDLDEFEKVSMKQRTTYVVKRHENWLKSLGYDIFYEKIVKYIENSK